MRVEDGVFSTALQEEKRRTDIVEKTHVGTEFDFEPVPLEVFIKDKKFLGLPPLSPKQFDAVEVCTQVYFPETLEELGWRKRRYCTNNTWCWGKSSGKDFCARIVFMRLAYLLLALKNPQTYFSFASESEWIDMLNTASNDTQAVNVFFSPLQKYLKKSEFFKHRVDVLTHEIRFDKAIRLFSGHSEAEPMEGMNLLAVVLDEISAFKTDDEVAELARTRARKSIPRSASSLYDFARTSVTTRFPKVGKVIMISYPRYQGDFITTQYEADKNDPNAYVSFGATFDINPTKKKSDFDDLKKSKPEVYNCRILCNPGVAEDAFFKNTGAILKTFKREEFNPVDSGTNKFKPEFVCRDRFLRYGHVDLAKNRCLAAFAFCHVYDTQERTIVKKDTNEQIVIEQPLIKVDIVKYFKNTYGGEIDFEQVLSDVVEMAELRGFNFGMVTFDGFQSVQMRQSLDKLGIPVGELSVDRNRKAYDAFQDVMYDGRLTSYYEKYLVEQELPFLVDMKGRKIEHRQGKSKDGTDALAGAVFNCVSVSDYGSSDFWSE